MSQKVRVLLLAAVLRPSAAAAEAGLTTMSMYRPSQSARSGKLEGRQYDYRAVSVLGLGGAYVVAGAWAWVAWYRDQSRLPVWQFAGDGSFGFDTYAGGADKLGHAWTAMVLTRLGASLLDAGGWSYISASVLALSLGVGALSLVEINDGYYTQFSPGDFAANVAGVGAALAFRHIPWLDKALDFRVQWFPSPVFRRHPSANFAEDYSGQTYLLAFKLRAFMRAREAEGALKALQFVNPVIGFETRGYVPAARPGERVAHRQTLFLGLSIDVQAILDIALRSYSSKAGRVSSAIGQTLFEYVNLPLFTLRAVDVSRQEAVVTR